jgi:hypothetical protein
MVLGPFRSGARAGVISILLYLTACAAGCRSNAAAVPQPPQAQINLQLFNGTSLSGPMPTAVAAGAPRDAMAVTVRVIALEQWPADALEPLAARARLIAATRSGTPVVAAAKVADGARVGIGDASAGFRAQLESGAIGGNAALGNRAAALPAGATAEFEAADPSSRPHRSVSVAISRPADAAPPGKLRMALVVEDLPPAAAASPAQMDETAAPAPPDASLPQRETVLLDDIPFDGALQAVIVVPFRLPPAPHPAVAFLIDIAPGSDEPAHADALATSAAALQASAAAAAQRPQTALLSADDSAGLTSAVRALAQPQSRRPALVFLTTQANAPLCGDVALTCDDDVLAVLAGRIWQHASRDALQSPQAFGWTLDYLTLQLLTEMLSNDQVKLPPELAAVLARHCGEAGRHASSLEEILKGASSQKDLNNRLIAENLIYLEDSAPASRVRAYDWLGATGNAPQGYEPLDPVSQRRDALERALNSAAPTTQQGQP